MAWPTRSSAVARHGVSRLGLGLGGLDDLRGAVLRHRGRGSCRREHRREAREQLAFEGDQVPGASGPVPSLTPCSGAVVGYFGPFPPEATSGAPWAPGAAEPAPRSVSMGAPSPHPTHQFSRISRADSVLAAWNPARTPPAPPPGAGCSPPSSSSPSRARNRRLGRVPERRGALRGRVLLRVRGPVDRRGGGPPRLGAAAALPRLPRRVLSGVRRRPPGRAPRADRPVPGGWCGACSASPKGASGGARQWCRGWLARCRHRSFTTRTSSGARA